MARLLSFSAALSIVILVLHFREAAVNHWTRALFATAPVVFTLGHNIYFLVRYLQRRSTILQQRADGTNVWPIEPLFPGASERNHLLTLGVAALYFHFVWGWAVLPKKGVFNLRWAEDVEGIALTASYWLEIVVAFYILRCATTIRTIEDGVLCAHAHRRTCKKCHLRERDCAAPLVAPTRLRVPPIRVLIPSLVFAAIFANVAYRHHSASQESQVWFYAFAVTSALAVVHRAYFILRILYISCRRGADAPAWPFSPFIPSTRERALYAVGNASFFELYCYATVMVASEGWAFLRQGLLERFMLVTLGGLLVVDGVAVVFGIKMDKAERRAQCISEGHEWKCTRLGCKADHAADSPSELGNVEEKIGGNLEEKV
jgi:hypothetical protein